MLIEWKYTESYPRRTPDPKRDAVRRGRYGAAVAAPTSPIRSDVLSFEMLLDEPIYQLVRQQLLAHALEQSGAEGAERVRVLHVCPRANDAYQGSLHRPEQRTVGSTVEQVWSQLLQHPTRFTSCDSEIFLDPTITSNEYVWRYAPDVVVDEESLLERFGVPDSVELEGALDFHGHIVLSDGAVDLVVGTEGSGLDYPFRAVELVRLADELAAGDG